jgi:hypothetical protein
MFWAAPLTTMLTKKANIDPAVRAKLEELGVDTVRSKLVWIMNVRDFAQQDELQPPWGSVCQLHVGKCRTGLQKRRRAKHCGLELEQLPLCLLPCFLFCHGTRH